MLVKQYFATFNMEKDNTDILVEKIMYNETVNDAMLACSYDTSIINKKRNHGVTLLHLAVISNNVKNIQLLLQNNANVHQKDEYENTPIHYANSPEIAELLVQKGARLDAKNKYGLTLLDVSLRTGNFALVKYLLKEKQVPYESAVQRIGLTISTQSSLDDVLNHLWIQFDEDHIYSYDTDSDCSSD